MKILMSVKRSAAIIVFMLSVTAICIAVQQRMIIFGVDVCGLLDAVITDTVLRIIVIVLVAVTTLLSYGLYLTSKPLATEISNTTVANTETSNTVFSGGRKVGRPPKPCDLACSGLMKCPFVPDLEPNEKLVEAVAKKLRLTETSAKTPVAKQTKKKTKEEKMKGKGVGTVLSEGLDNRKKREKEKEKKREKEKEEEKKQ